MPPTDDHPHGDSDDHEEVLADLLWEYVDRLNAGESLDAKIIRAEHPELAGELLLELETLKGWQPDESGMPETAPLGTLGDYTLRRQIGRGGMGVVYEAWENSMDRAVALKVLPAAVAADKKARRKKIPIDHRTDVYSVGVTMYEMLAWRPPFRGKDHQDTLSQIIERDPDATLGCVTGCQ